MELRLLSPSSTGALSIKPVSLSSRHRFSHVDEGLCGVVGKLHDTGGLAIGTDKYTPSRLQVHKK